MPKFITLHHYVGEDEIVKEIDVFVDKIAYLSDNNYIDPTSDKNLNSLISFKDNDILVIETRDEIKRLINEDNYKKS